MEDLIVKNKKLCFILSFLYLSSAHGFFPVIHGENLSGDYKHRVGSAFADTLSYKIDRVNLSHQNIQIDVNKGEKHLIINDNNTTVELNFNFSFLNVFEELSFQNLCIESQARSFNVNGKKVNLYFSPEQLVLENVKFNSLVKTKDLADDFDFLAGFISHSELSIDRIDLGNIMKKTGEILLSEFPESEDIKSFASQKTIPVLVKKIQLNINEGVFNGSAKVDSYINLWPKISGIVETISNGKTLHIHLEKAKIGIFSVRGLLLRMLSKLGIEQLKIEGNHIYINVSE